VQVAAADDGPRVPVAAAAAEEFDDVLTFDDLVIEEPRVEPIAPISIVPEPVPVSVPNMPPPPRVDAATLREWESALGLDNAPRTAPPPRHRCGG
jgi:hypothetical protein